jgi:hypothetical protein
MLSSEGTLHIMDMHVQEQRKSRMPNTLLSRSGFRIDKRETFQFAQQFNSFCEVQILVQTHSAKVDQTPVSRNALALSTEDGKIYFLVERERSIFVFNYGEPVQMLKSSSDF